jgi:hypothetical protein
MHAKKYNRLPHYGLDHPHFLSWDCKILILAILKPLVFWDWQINVTLSYCWSSFLRDTPEHLNLWMFLINWNLDLSHPHPFSKNFIFAQTYYRPTIAGKFSIAMRQSAFNLAVVGRASGGTWRLHRREGMMSTCMIERWPVNTSHSVNEHGKGVDLSRAAHVLCQVEHVVRE